MFGLIEGELRPGEACGDDALRNGGRWALPCVTGPGNGRRVCEGLGTGPEIETGAFQGLGVAVSGIFGNVRCVEGCELTRDGPMGGGKIGLRAAA